MSEVSDETLMAYADGELGATELQQVEAYLQEHPKAEERVRMFVRTGVGLRQMFDRPSREPVPARLLATVLGATTGSAGRRRDNIEVAGRITSVFEWILPAWKPIRLGIAFSAVFMVGAGLGWYWQVNRVQWDATARLAEMLDGRVLAQGDLSRALDTAPSGTPVRLVGSTGPAVLRPVLTFQTQDGNYCRQYEMDTVDALRFLGLACRDVFGRWRLEVHTANGMASSSTGKMAPAGAATSPVVDAAVERSIKGDVLGREEEAALIKKQWRAPRQ